MGCTGPVTWRDNTTSNIAYNASVATVKSALLALDDGYDASAWTVTGSNGGPYTLTAPGSGALTGSGTGPLPAARSASPRCEQTGGDLASNPAHVSLPARTATTGQMPRAVPATTPPPGDAPGARPAPDQGAFLGDCAIGGVQRVTVLARTVMRRPVVGGYLLCLLLVGDVVSGRTKRYGWSG